MSIDLTKKTSIFELPPLEEGGVVAREGFDFQDHVAVSFVVGMISELEEQTTEVWCENQDDITLIIKENDQLIVEFVQVKGNKLDQLWSVSELCKREGTPSNSNGIGASIPERSLAYDRCTEPSRFRLVTLRDVKANLKALTSPIEAV